MKKVIQKITHMIFAILQWVKKQIQIAKRSILVNNIVLTMIHIIYSLCYAILNTSILIQYFNAAKETTNTLMNFDIVSIGLGMKYNFLIPYYGFVVVVSIITSLIKIKNNKIGKYTYNKQLKRKYGKNVIITNFLKVSTIDTLFFIIVSTLFQHDYTKIFFNIKYLVVLFVGIYVIQKLVEFGLPKGIEIFLNYTLSLFIRCHKLTGNFDFAINNNIVIIFVVMVIFTIIQTILETNSVKFFEQYRYCKKKHTKKVDELYEKYATSLFFKNIVKNIYLVTINILPIILKIVEEDIWYISDGYVFFGYLPIIIFNIVLNYIYEHITNLKNKSFIEANKTIIK